MEPGVSKAWPDLKAYQESMAHKDQRDKEDQQVKMAFLASQVQMETWALTAHPDHRDPRETQEKVALLAMMAILDREESKGHKVLVVLMGLQVKKVIKDQKAQQE